MTAGTRFLAPDLGALPAPDVIEALDYEAILAARVADLKARWPQWDVGALETDPLKINEETGSYFELLLRGRVNDAARAVLITHASGADLDAIGARFGTVRFDGEKDGPFRRRIQLSLEASSSAGPAGAYRYHALSAHPLVKGVGLSVPTPGSVVVAVLSREGDGTASAEVVDAVRTKLMQDNIRPLTVAITVKPAIVTPYTIAAHLRIPAGPDPETLKVAAEQTLAALAVSRHVVGQTVNLSAIIAAAHVANVQSVTISEPNGDLVAAADEVLWCAGITVTYEVI